MTWSSLRFFEVQQPMFEPICVQRGPTNQQLQRGKFSEFRNEVTLVGRIECIDPFFDSLLFFWTVISTMMILEFGFVFGSLCAVGPTPRALQMLFLNYDPMPTGPVVLERPTCRVRWQGPEFIDPAM